LAQQATKGPWKVCCSGYGAHVVADAPSPINGVDIPVDETDAQHIAAWSPEVTLAFLDERDRMLAEVEALRRVARSAMDIYDAHATDFDTCAICNHDLAHHASGCAIVALYEALKGLAPETKERT
jgi:hypothetical protein